MIKLRFSDDIHVLATSSSDIIKDGVYTMRIKSFGYGFGSVIKDDDLHRWR